MRAATLFAIALAVVCATAAAETPEQIFKRVSPSVVVVESLDGKGSVVTLGSGVVIAPKGWFAELDRAKSEARRSHSIDLSGGLVPAVNLIVTNRHVIEDGVTYRVGQNGKKWPAKLLRVDPDHDLAELSVNGLNAPPVQVRNSSTLEVGEKVYAIGAPEGLELTISEGLISGLRNFGQGEVIQTSAAISPGSSGGGLFDAEGRLVGITTFYLKEGQSLNFALPAEWIAGLPQRAKAEAAAGASASKQESAWGLTSLVLMVKSDWQGLLKLSQNWTAKDPRSEMAWSNLGLAYNGLGQYNAALSAYHQAIHLKPTDEDAWAEMGSAYYSLGQYDKAASADQQSLRLKPDDEPAWALLGFAYRKLAQLAKAVAAYQEAISLKPDDEAVWFQLGVTYGELGQYDKAAGAEQQSLRLKPDDESAWAVLGLSYGLLGQYSKEVSAEQEAIRLKPDDARAWVDLGSAYRKLDQQSEVTKVYEKLKTLDPKLADKFFKEDVLP
ncbi:MAG: trypsin-like peptidase domain-containing protein [Terriglobia bacterium]